MAKENGAVAADVVGEAVELVEARRAEEQRRSTAELRKQRKAAEGNAFSREYFELCLRHGWHIVGQIVSVSGGPPTYSVQVLPAPEEASDAVLQEYEKQLHQLREQTGA